MTQIATQLSRELRGIPGVDNVGAHVGRAVGVGPGRRRQLERGLGQHRLRRRLRRDGRVDRGRRRPRAQRRVTTSSPTRRRRSGTSARCNEGENPVTGDGLDVLTGSDKPLAVRVFGQDQDVLRRQAAKVQQLVSGVDGVDEPAHRAAGRAAEPRDRGGPRRRPALRASSPATCAARRPPCCRASRSAACSRTRRSSR